MESTIDLTKDYFFVPNACQVCRAYGKDVKLRRCSKCNSIPYCSKEHEVDHRPRHEEFCKAFCKVLSVTHTILRAFQSFQLRDIRNNTNLSWKIARLNLVRLTETEIGRELSNFEKSVILFARNCEICNETHDSKLNDCGDCPDASFCVDHPKDSQHSDKCQQSRICFTANTTYPNPQLITLATIAFKSHYGERVPTDMDEAIGLFLSHPLLEKYFPSTEIYAVLMSNDITRVYTFLYVMKKLSAPMLPDLTIHVIVKDVEEQNKALFWQNLFHHNLPFRKLDISHFNPELTSKREEFALCDECNKKNCSITVKSVGKTYAEFSKVGSFSKPDIVIAYNVALDDDDLGPSIQLVAKLGCPFFITTYLPKETEANELKINHFLGKTVKPFWTGKNPFASRKPYKDFDTDQFIYNNQYLTIYKSLA